MIRQLKITVCVKEVSAGAPDVDIASAHVSHFIDERAWLASKYPADWLRYELSRALEEPGTKLANAIDEHFDKD